MDSLCRAKISLVRMHEHEIARRVILRVGKRLSMTYPSIQRLLSYKVGLQAPNWHMVRLAEVFRRVVRQIQGHSRREIIMITIVIAMVTE